MITKISNLNFHGAQKNSNMAAQNTKSKNSAGISYKSGYDEDFKQQKRNALGLSLTTIFGAMLFLFGYFIFAGLKNGKLS